MVHTETKQQKNRFEKHTGMYFTDMCVLSPSYFCIETALPVEVTTLSFPQTIPIE